MSADKQDELTVDVYFSADALRVTQKFAHEFLADCFNGEHVTTNSADQ